MKIALPRFACCYLISHAQRIFSTTVSLVLNCIAAPVTIGFVSEIPDAGCGFFLLDQSRKNRRTTVSDMSRSSQTGPKQGSTSAASKVEQALRASERRYRLLFEQNLAGILRTTLDGRVLECNLAFARILDYR